MLDNIKLATRKSPLALKQANIVKNRLIEKGVFKKIEIVPMTTTGDVANKKTFKEDGGKGLFLKELENALYTPFSEAFYTPFKGLVKAFKMHRTGFAKAF